MCETIEDVDVGPGAAVFDGNVDGVPDACPACGAARERTDYRFEDRPTENA